MPNKDPEKRRATAREWARKTRCANLEEARARDRQKYASDPQKARQTIQRYRDTHPDRVKATQQKHSAKRKAERLLAFQKWQEAHPHMLVFAILIILLRKEAYQRERRTYFRVWGVEYRAEKKRIRKAMDPQQLAPILAAERAYQRLYQQGRRARMRGLPWIFTAEDVRFMFEYWNHCCAICGNQEGLLWTLALDHWIPVTSPICPGTVVTNILPLCHGIGGCNNVKWRHDGPTWLRERLGVRKANLILKAINAYFAIVEARQEQSSPAAD